MAIVEKDLATTDAARAIITCDVDVDSTNGVRVLLDPARKYLVRVHTFDNAGALVNTPSPAVKMKLSRSDVSLTVPNTAVFNTTTDNETWLGYEDVDYPVMGVVAISLKSRVASVMVTVRPVDRNFLGVEGI